MEGGVYAEGRTMTDTVRKPKFIKSVDDAIWRDMRKKAIDLDLTMGEYIEMIHAYYLSEMEIVKQAS